jgi:hypothetical protein
LDGQEFQYIDDILKEFYAPAIVNQVYKKAPFWAQVQKRDKGMVGRRVVIPVQTAFTEAVGSRVANNYALPTAQRNTYDTAYIYMKRIYGRVQVDGFSIESAKGKGGWVDVLTAETKGVANAFAMEVDRQSMGRGTCILGTYVSGAGSTTIYVDAPHGIAGDTPLGKWFRAGMVIDSYDIDNSYAQLDNGLTITAVNASTGALTVDSACSSSLADGDYFCREDTFSSTAASLGDMMGIDGIIDSSDVPGSDFGGIARSSYSIWQAYEDSTSQVLSEDVIQSLLDGIEKRTDGESPNLALTTYDLRNKLISLIRSDRMIDTMELKGGWKAISYVGGNVSLPILTHKNCPTGYFYAISLPHIVFYTLKNFVWDNKGGGIVKPVAGYDAYESWFKMYGNIGTDCCNAHGKLTGLTTS